MERLQEERQALRKQLVAKALDKVVSAAEDGVDVQELRSKVRELERMCESGQRQNEMEKREVNRLRAQLEESREQVGCWDGNTHTHAPLRMSCDIMFSLVPWCRCAGETF